MTHLSRCLLIAACLVLTLALDSAAFEEVSKDGWLYTETVRNPGSRSEYLDTSLTYKGLELPGEYAPVVTPVGTFSWMSGG